MLKVMTLNLFLYEDEFGAWPQRRDLIRREIERRDPDIIAFQAVRRAPEVAEGRDPATQLSEMLPAYRFPSFQAAVQKEGGAEEGLAFLSKIPSTQQDYLNLTLIPGLEDTTRRILFHARFDLSEEPFQLFNGYFSWVDEQARRNVAESLPVMRSFTGPALLVGDLNTPASSDVFEPWRENGWRDVWAKLRPEQPGLTFPADDPEIRIDYVWANAVAVPEVREIQMIANQTGSDGVRPSNHFGLLVSLDLEV